MERKNKLRKISTAVLLLCFTFLFSPDLNAQDTIKEKTWEHQIKVGSGYANHIIQDNVLSPLVYSGSTIAFWLTYEARSKNYLHLVQSYFDTPNLHSGIPQDGSGFPHNTKNINGFLAYSLSRKVLSQNENKLDFFIGGKLQSFGSYRKLYYLTNISGENVDFNTSLGVSLIANRFFKDSESLVSFKLSTPIITYATSLGTFNANARDKQITYDPDKNGVGQYFCNGDVVFINRLFELQSELSVNKSLNNRLSLGATYFFHFYNFKVHDDLAPIKYVNNQLLAELIIKL